MPLLPHQTLVIDSPLPADEALARLRAQTGQHRWFRWGRVPYPFEGEVAGSEVRIQRVIRYRNSFLPRIRGWVEPSVRGSRFTATLSLHPLVTVFMLVWFAMALAIGIPMTAVPLAEGSADPLALIPLAMLAFGWGMVSGAFTYEARVARDRLAAILEGEPR